VTFDYKVPENNTNPEVLAINIIELEEESGDYANGIDFAQKYLRLQVNAEEYIGTKVLAVPRCCQWKKGTQDRGRINADVRSRTLRGKEEAVLPIQ
jgi:hypothetical protein